MARSISQDDPNPELGNVERALVAIALFVMVSYLLRELYGWASGVKRIRKLQSEVDAIRASDRGDMQSSDHSD